MRRIKSLLISAVGAMAVLSDLPFIGGGGGGGGGHALAVIVAGGDGLQNRSAPAGFESQWAHVGRAGSSSAVYLGNGWVLNAWHAGGGINLGGVDYSAIPGSVQRLNNPDGSYTDLKLFRISADPGLPGVTLGDFASVPVGSRVMMIGFGIQRLPTEVFYKVQVVSDEEWIWTELPSAQGADISGYKMSGNYTKGWGSALTTSMSDTEVVPQLTIDVGLGPVTLLRTTMNDYGDGQAFSGDSGGGVFDSQGRLVGILDLIDSYPSQPANTTLFGQSTYFIDLSVYLNQIRGITGTTPVIPEPSFAFLLVALPALLAHRRRRLGQGA